MNLYFNRELAKPYISNSQIARVLTENWVLENSYCPNCGNLTLSDFESNRPVADFYCIECNEEFELKSKKGNITKTITDGSYEKMITRINADNNPNFFFLTYSQEWCVNNFLIIPKHFFTNEIIIKRPPLAKTARRAGWVGCNINLAKIPTFGKVFLVKDGKVINKKEVNDQYGKMLFIRKQSKTGQGWIIDILKCIDSIPQKDFTLQDVYRFEKILKQKYPNNNFVKDKIRQQLQILRDKGVIEFISRGKYRKLGDEKI